METSSEMEMDEGMEIETSGSSTTMIVNQDTKSLLLMARQHIHEGNASLALQAVVAAVKSDGGEQAVIQTLNRARELYRNKLQTSAAADELASLFAECAIAEAEPVKSEPSPTFTMKPQGVATSNADDSSILAKTGRKQIMLDAFMDGSSFVCLQCGGLVSKNRKDEHLAYWCCGI